MSDVRLHPALAAQQVSYSYQIEGEPLPALRGVNLEVRRGEFVCLVGPSGCGKTTLLRLMAGLLEPESGIIALDGVPVTEPDRRVGYVFQQANLMPWRTVMENISLPLELSQIGRQERETRAQELIRLVGLEGFERSYPAELSGGMAQRVAIARALIRQPDILLLDEPFGSLDAMTREQLGEELLRIWWEKNETLDAVLMVTHSITESILLADRIYVMSPRPGRITEVLPVEMPRPRTLAMLHSEAAGTLAGIIRAALRQD